MDIQQSESMRRVIKARSQLIVSHPFIGVLCLHLKIEIDNGADNPTMATDGVTLWINESFVATLTDAELRGVLAHEVWHCGCLHMDRRGKRDARQWNEAADYAINDDLTEMGFTLPKGALLDSKFRGLSAESIFADLQRQRQQQPKQGQSGQGAPVQGGGSPGQGSAPGNDPGQCGAIRDRPASNGDLAGQWKARTLQAAAVAKAQAGKLPGSMERLIAELRSTRTSWKEILRRFVDQSAIKSSSWSRPNRRFIAGGLYLPGKQSDAAQRILVGIDTSGSIDNDALTAFASELQELLDANCCDKISVAYCDTQISSIVEYEAGDSVKLVAQGGGGTSFVPVLKWAGEQTDAACVIYFTDLAGTFGDDPGVPVLWATWIDRARAPFGELIKIDSYE